MISLTTLNTLNAMNTLLKDDAGLQDRLITTITSLPEAAAIQVLMQADDDYYNAEPSMPDSQYDTLRRVLEKMYPANVYFTGVGSAIRGGKVKLPHRMGSLDQIYEGDFEKWIDNLQLTDEALIVTHKLDGASALIVYGGDGRLQIAYSRGDGLEGADITRHVSQISSVPQAIQPTGETVMVRVENIISPTNFEKLKKLGITTSAGKPYKNPRNMVSGCMNASEIDPICYDYIDTIAYEIVTSTASKQNQLIELASMGFKIVRSTLFAKAGDVTDDILTTTLNRARAESKYEIDGIVIDVNSSQTRARLTDKNRMNPLYAVKYKVADASNFAQSRVIGVEWNLSKHGYLKPRVQIEPVDLVGVTVQYATGFNAKFIKDNLIGPGAVINITRSGDVIPYITGVSVPAALPDLPDLQYKWTDTGVDIFIEDHNSNTTVLQEQMIDFFSTLDVPKLKEGNLKAFVDLGILDIALIIDMTEDDIINVVGSKPIGKEIYAGITSKLTDIPMYKLMGASPAFGRGIGVRKMKKLWEAFEGDMSKCVDVDLVTAVEGFDTKTAVKVKDGYDKFMRFYEAVKHRVKIKEYEAGPVGVFTSKVFVFTGFRSSELEGKIQSLGGTMSSSVSKNTTYLVTTDPSSTSGKAKKARDLGVTILTVAELEEMIDG